MKTFKLILMKWIKNLIRRRMMWIGSWKMMTARNSKKYQGKHASSCLQHRFEDNIWLKYPSSTCFAHAWWIHIQYDSSAIMSWPLSHAHRFFTTSAVMCCYYRAYSFNPAKAPVTNWLVRLDHLLLSLMPGYYLSMAPLLSGS